MTRSIDQGARCALRQSNNSGWLVGMVLCLLAVLAGPVPVHAGTFTPSQLTFAPTQVSVTSASVLVTLTATTGGTVTSETVLTEGSAAQARAEFAIASGGTCATSVTINPGQICSVAVTFTPRFPGLRHGAVELIGAGGQVLASSLVSGLGQGGLPILIPGQIGTVAGDGQWFYQGDGVPAVSAPIYLPSGLAVDGDGNLYLADTINNRIRRVDAVTQNISTVAGNGNAGSQGDGGSAVDAELTSPGGIALDGAGNLYIADTGNNTIRRVDAVTHLITTIAGTAGASGYTGDGNPAIGAKLNAPQGIALTAAGDVLIADTSNAVVRLVTMEDGKIQTLAGTGTAGYNGDGILATTAQLNEPSGIAVRFDGAIAIADLSNNRVRLVDSSGTISTVAGDGTIGYTGDGGAATQAQLQGPAAVVFDPAGDLIIADSVNNCIRLVYGQTATIMTLAGIPSDDRFAGDGGPDDQARMHGPDGLFLDAGGNLWISDRFNNRVREVRGSLLTIGPYPTMKVGKTSQPVVESMLNAGNGPLTLKSPALQQASLDATTTTCNPSPINPSAFCKMGVEFAPTTIGASVNGAITWNSDAPNVSPIDQLYGEVLSVEPTSVALTSSTSPALLGQPVTLLATVSSADKGRTGTVDFVEGSQPNQTWCSGVPLAANGTASCTIPSLSLGTHSFTASYSGDNNNAASQSPVFQVTVKQQAALALSVSSSPTVVTNTVTLSISAGDATGTPTGTVTFYDGATALATATLDANGNASWSSNTLAVGTHTLSAQYSGDSANVSGSSPSKLLVVNQASSLTVLSSSNNNAAVGSSVTLTANVVAQTGPAPTGSIQFMEGQSALGTTPLDASGSAVLTLSTLAPGTHILTAVYSGNTDDATSTSAVLVQKILQIGTITTLGADVDPLNAGAAVHLAAIVAIAPGAQADGVLTGTVVFSDGSIRLGTAAINASGQATLAVNGLTVGSHAITAEFSGNSNYATSQSTALTETVQQTMSMAVLTSSATTVLMGEPVVFGVTVTSPTGVPTGTVTLKDGAGLLGTVILDAHGSSTLTTTKLVAGTHSITAIYNGDANYQGSTTAALQQTVNLAIPSVVLSGPASPIDAGTTMRFNAMLNSPGLSPTGTVALMDGTNVVATVPVSTTGAVTFAVTLAVGNHVLTAKYGGDADNASASSSAVLLTVQRAATTTMLTSTANPLTLGQPLSLTAFIKSNGPNVGGSVSFFDGTRLLGTAPVSSSGTVTYSPQNLALGLHNLTAVYSGDGNHVGSNSQVVPELVVQSSTLAVSSSVNPSVSGETVTFTGQMRGEPVLTGNLSFRDNGTLLSTVPLNTAGVATYATAALNVGNHSVVVTYSGDSNYATTTSQISQTVLNANTATTLSVSSNPATYGSPLTLQATVTSNGGPATGLVNFTEAGRVLGAGTVDASGTAIFTTAGLGAGSHTIVASYLGDGKASASTSAPLALAVKQITSLLLTSGTNPAQTLSDIAFTVALHSAGAATATGSVSFNDGTSSLGTASLDGTGHAVLHVPQLAAGTHVISAVYSGDGSDFTSQSGSYNQVVQVRPTTTTVTGTATDPSNPQQMTLIAVVHGDGSVPPGGLVSFTNGPITLGAASVDSTGVATITVIFETLTQPVVASYGGDASYGSSQSAVTNLTAGHPAQFTLTLDSANITLVSHQRTTVNVTLSSVKGFTDKIGLGCLGLPFAATCTFSNSQLKLAADGTATASLVIDTGDPLGAGTSTTAGLGSPRLILCFPPAALLFGCLLRRKNRTRLPMLMLLLLAAVVVSSGLSGCSGLQMSGTPPGTYTFQVIGTGQGSNTTEAQPVTMVVTQ